MLSLIGKKIVFKINLPTDKFEVKNSSVVEVDPPFYVIQSLTHVDSPVFVPVPNRIYLLQGKVFNNVSVNKIEQVFDLVSCYSITHCGT